LVKKEGKMKRIVGYVIGIGLAAMFCIGSLATAEELQLLSQGLPESSYTASSYLTWANPPSVAKFAFDGDEETAWAMGPDYTNSWLMVDLGKDCKIVKTVIIGEKRFLSEAYFQYKIEVSSDKKNWTIFVDKTKNTEVAGPSGYTDMGEAVGRYVRLTYTGVKEPKDWYWPVVCEFKVYGVPLEK